MAGKRVIESYKDLIVWQRSMQLVTEMYRLTASFPSEERFGLTNQLRRASVSIPSNIAEGYGRGTRKEYKQFLCVARGSTLEVQTQLQIAQELGFATAERLRDPAGLSEEISRMLYGLIAKL